MCREAVAPGRRWGATTRLAAWIDQAVRGGERRTRKGEKEKERRRDGKRAGDTRERGTERGRERRVGRRRCKGGGKVNAPQGNATRYGRAKQYRAYVRVHSTALYDYAKLSRMRSPSLSPFILFLRCLTLHPSVSLSPDSVSRFIAGTCQPSFAACN